MSEWLDYLSDSTLVARFQRRCGLFLSDGGSSGTDPPPDREHPRTTPKNQPENNRHQGWVQPQYEVRNWPLYVLFLVSATLGNEVFYITVLPGIQWHVDPFLCRRLVNMWTDCPPPSGWLAVDTVSAGPAQFLVPFTVTGSGA
ncbi:hypothetical protein NHX12_008735 [Muraenolepis orangiensis]|uniref:Uncharacterized protein n=1 Tax=Muraenolepis orangiensis TaxID=630683 RepID=A0A9Q0I8C0_9TELE|nr:hypothetical protein NHX12_008735 [Muraenolepis orangiensis]